MQSRRCKARGHYDNCCAGGGTETGGKKASPKQAEYARERACGAEWKAEKAAGKVPEGMTWPKYWSDCDKRKKAAGM